MFPSDFLWGAANSSHQVEGGNVNDWSCWEKENAERLAREAKTYWQNWQREKFPEMFKLENYVSGRACAHYNLYEKDFDIAKSLGHNAHRFSIEWSRIEPEEGKFNEKEIKHYQKVIDALHKRGIEPFVTLWHWANPLWIRDIGGWENEKTVDCFLRYVEKIVEKLGDDVKFWITLNEPDDIYVFEAYLRGRFPPQKKNLLKTIKAFKNLSKAHKKAYEIIHNYDPDARVGFVNNVIYFEAYKNYPWNRILKYVSNRYWNFWFFRKTMPYHDFIGCNYYYHKRIKFNWLRPTKSFNRNDNCEVSDIGFEIYPEGIYHVLKNLKKYNLPVYILENGIADFKDEKRGKFIKDHLYWAHKAIKEGVDIRGYFYWSLLDNFEWDKGFWPRFGLVEIDYKTMKRKIRPSAFAYKKIIENRSV